jgi:hypothetical protein
MRGIGPSLERLNGRLVHGIRTTGNVFRSDTRATSREEDVFVCVSVHCVSHEWVGPHRTAERHTNIDSRRACGLVRLVW